MKNKILTCTLILAFASPAIAERSLPDVGVGAVAGSLGVGLTLTVPIIPELNVRAYGAGLSFGVDVEVDDADGIQDNELDFDGDVTVGGVGALLDYHPFRNGFRASAGVLYNFNKFEGTAVCDETLCEVDGQQPPVVARGDRVRGEVDYSGVAPYVGLGWGNAVDKNGRWSFSFDVGAMFTGSPDVSVRCTQVAAGAAAQSICNQQAEAEEDELEDEVGDFKVYPVVSLGFAYRF